MPEPIKPDEEEKKDKPLGVEVREKTFQQILQEQKEERAKPAEDVETEEQKAEKVKLEEEKKAQDEEAAKAKQEEDRRAETERQAQIAKAAADEVIKRQEEEKQKEQDRIKAEEDEKKRQEELKPKFTGTDEKGNPVPSSYEELAAESARIGKEQALAEMEEKQRAERAEADRITAEKTKNDEAIKEQQKAAEDQLQKELDSDLNDLYANGKLPKIKDPKNEKDPGNLEFKNLFETAQRVNAERMAKGEAPIRSIKLIYYEHYKPLSKPAGHDAPVLGAESMAEENNNDDKYIVSRDRNKSFAQLAKEEAARLAKKIGVRGK